MVHMFESILICVLMLLCKDNFAFQPTTKQQQQQQHKHKYEEYYIEHEISSIQAKNSAYYIDLKAVNVPPGCQECTKAEIAYCLGGDIINDHCCCDKRYEEVFPYIPHTCYLGEQLCQPIIGDCAQYSRLRECCCDRYTKEYWKNNLKSSIDRVNPRNSIYYLLSVIILFIFFY